MPVPLSLLFLEHSRFKPARHGRQGHRGTDDLEISEDEVCGALLEIRVDDTALGNVPRPIAAAEHYTVPITLQKMTAPASIPTMPHCTQAPPRLASDPGAVRIHRSKIHNFRPTYVAPQPSQLVMDGQMTSKPDYFFLDGILLGPDEVALAAQYNAYANVDASRLLLKLQEQWTYIDFDEDLIRSLAFDSAAGILYMLGKSGMVYSLGGKGPGFTLASISGALSQEQVVDPEERGELFRIRVLDNRVLVCGLGGQLLELRNGTWHDIGFDTPIATSPDFEDVSLDAQGWPVAVGWAGAAYRFGPNGPEHIACPTNAILSTIVQDGRGRHLLCGNRGVAFEITNDSFRDLSIDDAQGNLWSIVRHADLVYACEPGRLMVRNQDQWQPEIVSQTIASPSFHRLVSTGSELWSFGADHVFVKRADDRWEQFPVIGNEWKP